MEENQQENIAEEQVEQNETSSGVAQAEDGTIKINLGELNKAQEAQSEAEVEQPEATEQPAEEHATPEEAIATLEEVIEEVTEPEVVNEEVVEKEQPTETPQPTGRELPEALEKLAAFMEETGGSLADYNKLNVDYDSLDEKQLMREYYEDTHSHLDKDEIDFLLEDKFDYDEDLDEERDIKRKKLKWKQELNQAKNHLTDLKSKYYQEVKSGSKLTPEQKEAVDFFNRYKKESREATTIAEREANTFLSKTDKVFSEDFKGFDFNVGDKKYRFNVKNPVEVKNTQSDINNFVKKFLNEKNEMSDAKGYHKSLFTAMNADAVAQHFYEQGKADAIKGSISKSKNVDMDPRGVHEKVNMSNGWSIRAVPSESAGISKLKIRK